MENQQKTQGIKPKADENQQFLTDIAQGIKEEFRTKSHKKRVKGLKGRKKLMVEALISKLGIVSDACKVTGVPRRTHYQWLKDDPRYKEATEDAEQVLKDIGEKALIGLLIEKNPSAVLHFNKTKNRDRGYGDHITQEEVGEKMNKIDKIELRVCKTREDVEFFEEYDKREKEKSKTNNRL
ncbi:MAG: hypothetical protein ACOCUU_03015 [Nanoarchaeota archaeon]